MPSIIYLMIIDEQVVVNLWYWNMDLS